MKSFFAVVLVAKAMAATNTARGGVTPVTKVVQLLEGMLAKGKAEKHDEQVLFASYKQFCDDTTTDKTRAIEESNDHIDSLSADIEKYTANAARLARQIAEHEGDIGAWDGDMKAATKVREIEHTDYRNMHVDLSESVDALQRAIQVLKNQAHDRPQSALLQVAALKRLALVPQEAKRAIDVFLQEPADDPLDDASAEFLAAPDADGYSFQSHHVIDMLEKLLDKFAAERTSLEKQEMNSKHAYDMLIQDLTAQTKQANEDKDRKTQNRANNLQDKADANADLLDTTNTRDADKAYLADLTAVCAQKAADFKARQQLRADEIAAVEQAIAILSSGSVAGHAATYLPSDAAFLQNRRGAALAHLRADASSSSQARAAQYLRARAGELASRVLSTLAIRVASDPFVKVRKMIQDLLIRLQQEASEEATHKGWCDTELATNEQTRKEKTNAVERLHAKIDGLKASIQKLTEEIADNGAEITRLVTVMAQLTELRNSEKATNAQTVNDAQESQAAVAQALTILKEFYAKAGEATALVQEHPEVPEIFTSSYKGMQAENGGVVGMLEVIMTDFARLEAETHASEAAAQKEYDGLMTNAKADKAARETDTEHRTAKKQDENQALITTQEDLEGNQKELDAALSYFDKLKPSCIDASVSYDGRVERRKEEIASLREALRILNGEDLSS